MSLIKCHICGTNTEHSKKHSFTRSESDIWDYYLIMYFKTPFWCSDGEKRISSEKGSYIIYPPRTAAEHGSLDVGFVNDWIFLNGKLAEQIISDFALPTSRPFNLGESAILERYIEKIAEEARLRRTCYEERSSALAAQMLIELGRRYEERGENLHPAFKAISDARAYMLTNASGKISVEALAKRAQYSVSRFCVLYKEFFGKTPIEELLDARIENARALLEYSHKSVTEVAEATGFSSIHYFSRKFKEKTGTAPSEYSKR